MDIGELDQGGPVQDGDRPGLGLGVVGLLFQVLDVEAGQGLQCEGFGADFSGGPPEGLQGLGPLAALEEDFELTFIAVKQVGLALDGELGGGQRLIGQTGLQLRARQPTHDFRRGFGPAGGFGEQRQRLVSLFVVKEPPGQVFHQILVGRIGQGGGVELLDRLRLLIVQLVTDPGGIARKGLRIALRHGNFIRSLPDRVLGGSLPRGARRWRGRSRGRTTGEQNAAQTERQNEMKCVHGCVGGKKHQNPPGRGRLSASRLPSPADYFCQVRFLWRLARSFLRRLCLLILLLRRFFSDPIMICSITRR